MSLQPFVHVDDALVGRCRGEQFALSHDELHHLRTVLRLQPGAELRVADGVSAWAPAQLVGESLLLLADATEVAPFRPQLVVAQALGKGRKLDEVVRVVTELGADAITVVAAERSITRLDGTKIDRAHERWRAVARAASEQSRRVVRPVVSGPVRTARMADGDGAIFIAHPGGEPLPAALADVGSIDRLTLMVGPEGGWTDDEVAGLVRSGGRPVGLGPSVLRTEHAAAAGLAVVSALVGRWSWRVDRGV